MIEPGTKEFKTKFGIGERVRNTYGKRRHIEMNANIKKLVELIAMYPNREVIAMVEHEVVWDDSYSRWIGSIGNAWVDQYYWLDDRVYLKSKDVDELKEDYIERVYDDYKHECFTDDDWNRLADEHIDGLEWIEAIIVNIDT